MFTLGLTRERGTQFGKLPRENRRSIYELSDCVTYFEKFETGSRRTEIEYLEERGKEANGEKKKKSSQSTPR